MTCKWVHFKVYDSLFKDWIDCVGYVTGNMYGKLWNILPDWNPRILGTRMIVHEDYMTVI